jgi:DNA-binding transcriptional MerR regulator
MVTNLISVKAIRNIIDKEDPATKEKIEGIITKAMAEKESRRKQPRLPAPKGSIGIREGAKKYGLSKSTVHKWYKLGYIPKVLDDGYMVYIDEERLKELATAIKSDPRPGSRAIKRYLKDKLN